MRYALVGVVFAVLGLSGLLFASVTEPSHVADVFGYSGLASMCLGAVLAAVGLAWELWDR